MKKKLGVIITYCQRLENLEALVNCILAENLSSIIQFYLVCLGDDDHYVKSLCEKAGIYYHFHEHNLVFNIGLAYNIGYSICKEKYLMKLDVDCLFYKGLFQLILKEISILKQNEFLLISVFYASKKFSENKLNIAPITKETFHDLKNDNVNFYGRPTGTMFIVRKDLYKKVGGHEIHFQGHGLEDFWFIIKILKALNPSFKILEPTIEKVRNIIFDLNERTNQKDIIFIHRYHERTFTDTYYSKYKDNETLLLENLKHINID